MWWTRSSTNGLHSNGTNCAPLLDDLLLHSYETDFIADLIQKKEHRLSRSFNLSFRYIDDESSLNNPSFGHIYQPHILTYTLRLGKEKLLTKLYGVFISQLIRYARACRYYADILYCARLLTIRLQKRIMLLQV